MSCTASGCGFNLGNFLVDLALGLDPQGRVKNLGVSGFYADPMKKLTIHFSFSTI